MYRCKHTLCPWLHVLEVVLGAYLVFDGKRLGRLAGVGSGISQLFARVLVRRVLGG